MSSAFEGSEKKLEIVVNPDFGSLRELPDSFWLEVIGAAGAKPLSKIENESITAYLLSESSLFIWADCLVLITCGTTTLVQSAELLIQKISQAYIEGFFFERKNEYFPHRQKTDFYDDIAILEKRLPLQSFRLGRADEHHLFLSYTTKNADRTRLDRTLEVLMYDLQGSAREVFTNPRSTVSEIRQKTQIHQIFQGFHIDDYSFDPTGYSLNAILENRYFTLHVTPQEISPYVSFETNVAQSEEEVTKTIASVLEIFKPTNFDVIYFDDKGLDSFMKVPGSKMRSYVRHQLDDSFFIQFGHFNQGTLKIDKAVPVKPL